MNLYFLFASIIVLILKQLYIIFSIIPPISTMNFVMKVADSSILPSSVIQLLAGGDDIFARWEGTNNLFIRWDAQRT